MVNKIKFKKTLMIMNLRFGFQRLCFRTLEYSYL